MRVTGVRLRDFRCYHDAAAPLGDGLTVVHGPNGAGKTNLVEGLYFGCTGRSCRTANDRELVRFGATTARVQVHAEGQDGVHELSVGFMAGERKVMRFDGAVVMRLLDVPQRPLVSVFLPDRLELIKGVPALRRAHLDQVVAALWPARSATRRSYAHTLAQRNALIARIRSGSSSRVALASWDRQLAGYGVALMADRDRAVQAIQASFTEVGDALGFDGAGALRYRRRSQARDADAFTRELAEHLEADLARGFSVHGPHRDDLQVLRDGRDLRTFGSQGQQRLALLALLISEREAISAERGWPPVMLLDDVMSELDRDRRESLAGLLRTGGGQAVITTTDCDQVPGAGDSDVLRLQVRAGRVREEALT